jgi:DNA repair protein RadA/Sms
LNLNSVGGLTSLVAEIAARGRAKSSRDTATSEKNATPHRFRRQEG